MICAMMVPYVFEDVRDERIAFFFSGFRNHTIEQLEEFVIFIWKLPILNVLNKFAPDLFKQRGSCKFEEDGFHFYCHTIDASAKDTGELIFKIRYVVWIFTGGNDVCG